MVQDTGAQTGLPRMPSMRLDGQRALVTGAGRGIGVACAAALAQAGAHVTLLSRSAGDLESVAAAIHADGGEAATLVLDIGDTDAVSRALADAPAFDILVNNAGTNRPASFADVTEKDFDDIMALNVRASFFTAQRVAKRLIDEGRPGSIINISSQMGHVGGARRSVYCTSKHAIEGLTKAMAIDLAPHGIRVNSICPTFIETPMTRPFFADPKFRAETLIKIKLGRIGQPEDLMGAVIFLASAASGLMTGSSVVIDGGWTAE